MWSCSIHILRPGVGCRFNLLVAIEFLYIYIYIYIYIYAYIISEFKQISVMSGQGICCETDVSTLSRRTDLCCLTTSRYLSRRWLSLCAIWRHWTTFSELKTFICIWTCYCHSSTMPHGLMSFYYAPGCNEFYYVPGSNELYQCLRMPLVGVCIVFVCIRETNYSYVYVILSRTCHNG